MGPVKSHRFCNLHLAHCLPKLLETLKRGDVLPEVRSAGEEMGLAGKAEEPANHAK
jgi:hypothetical protein